MKFSTTVFRAPTRFGQSGPLLPPYERLVARWVPTICRRDREWKQSDGRLYGETSAQEQEQADRRYWAVGAEVRAQKHPLVVAVQGTVERVYQVPGWIREQGETKYTALGSGVWLRGEDGPAPCPSWIPNWWPSEFTPGQHLDAPARQEAYAPAKVNPDGSVIRATR